MTGAYVEDPAEPLGSDVPDDPAGPVADPPEPESAVSAPPADPGEWDDAGPSVGRVGEPEGPDAVEVWPGLGLPDGAAGIVTGPPDLDESDASGTPGGNSLGPGFSSVPGLVACTVAGLSSAGVSLPYGPAPSSLGSPGSCTGPPSRRA